MYLHSSEGCITVQGRGVSPFKGGVYHHLGELYCAIWGEGVYSYQNVPFRGGVAYQIHALFKDLRFKFQMESFVFALILV